MDSSLKKLIQEWLRNDKLLGESMVEIEMQQVRLPLRGEGRGEPASPHLVEQDAPPVAMNQDSSPVMLSKGEELFEYYCSIKECKECDLYRTRNNLVFGEGNPDSKLVFIGEAPGREEDRDGHPFVGEAGKLLTRLIKGIGLEKSAVYITNIIKCRPPENRDPLPEEIAKCRSYLLHQLEIIKPKLLCTLGRHSTYSLLGIPGPFGNIRGKIYEYKDMRVVPTYHPAALLYHPGWSNGVRDDFKIIKQLYNE